MEAGVRWGLIVSSVPSFACGTLASFLLSLTFDLPAWDLELGWTSQGLMWGKEATALYGGLHIGQWTRAGLEWFCAG